MVQFSINSVSQTFQKGFNGGGNLFIVRSKNGSDVDNLLGWISVNRCVILTVESQEYSGREFQFFITDDFIVLGVQQADFESEIFGNDLDLELTQLGIRIEDPAAVLTHRFAEDFFGVTSRCVHHTFENQFSDVGVDGFRFVWVQNVAHAVQQRILRGNPLNAQFQVILLI